MSDELKTKMTRLAERLLERTSDGGVRWEETDRSDFFTAVLEGGSVVIGQAGGFWKGTRFEFTVRNDRGLTIETLAVPRDQPPVAPGESPVADENMEALRNVLLSLYEAARRSALEVDKTLDLLLGQLE